MRLKRLSLHGFKTFADKTEIEFAPGVTCIVGPNGSGKSNLLDALVWCLGEQKASSLRAHRAQDVIFAGSSRRRPMGLAEVSLTVDNEDRFLPLDFAEVTITRRVYPSGEGEYFLNKAACRLKDITDLFLDTGVGRGAYAIVNQSEIDAILSARPEDRRELFEEAAGIKKYRVKKREAQRKLENTQSNLVRVHDILSELQEQVEPLRQQAEVARKFRTLSERLREIEVGLLAADYQRLRDELEELNKAAAGASAEADHLRAESDNLEATASGLGQRIADAENHLEEVRLRQQLALTQVERLESRLALAEERRTGAARALGNLETDLATLAQERDRLAEEADAGDVAAAEAAERLDTLTRELADAEAVAREADRALTEMLQAAAGQEADYLALARKLAAQRADLVSLRERIARRAVEIAEAEQRASSRQGEVDAARADIASLTAALDAARAAHADARRVVAEEREPAARRAAEAVQSQVEERAAAERALAGQESRLRVLEETEAAQEGYFAGVRAVLNAASEGKLRGVYTLFADAIKVPARLETAIEIALGASLQDLIAGSERDAKAGIAYLNESRSGRATFLPLDALREQPVPDALRMAPRRHKGVLGSAADLVEFDAQFEPAVHIHLARVLVVEDLDIATEVARKIERDWARIVTLNGELVVPTGAITGGRTGRPGPNLLSRKREIGELTDAVEAGRERLERMGLALAQARTDEASARQAVRDAEAATLTARDAERDAERRVQARGLELDRLVRDAEAQASRARQLVESGAQETAREAALTAAVAESDRTDEGALATREELHRRRAALQVRKDEARDSARRLSAEAASLRERLAGLRRDAERARHGAVRAQTQAEERLQRAAEARSVIAAEEQETLQRQGERETTKAGLKVATDDLERWRERRQALVAENFQLTERVRLTQRAVQAPLEKGQQARLKAARIEAQAEAVGQRLQDEYDLHPDSAVALTGGAPVDRDTVQEIGRLRREIKGLGAVNAGAVEEYDRVSERHRFLLEQKADLDGARERLLAAIAEIDDSTRGVFVDTFREVGAAFGRYFTRLFGGGSTELVMTDPEDVLETGIEILAQPPGKRRQNLSLLSGGERALTATALLFAFLEVRPAPFCVLDEVDAPLDGANVEKFAELVREFGQRSQFILITHNATTMEAAPLWYGVTMQEPGVSRGISMRVPEPEPVSVTT